MSTRSRGHAAPRLRELAKQRTRQALIDAALACFSEDGIDAPSLDAICERAGCTRGAFYVHFADREALLVAAMESRRNAVLATFLDAAGSDSSLIDVIDVFAKAVGAASFPIAGAVRTAELLTACRRSQRVRSAQLSLMKKTAERLAKRAHADQHAHRLRSDVAAAAVSDLLLAAEAGVELLLDLGYEFDVSRAARALATLLTPAQQRTRRHRAHDQG